MTTRGRYTPKGRGKFAKVWYVFDDVAERDAFFTANPSLLFEDILIAIKDATPPPTPGTRMLDHSKSYNDQYKVILFP